MIKYPNNVMIKSPNKGRLRQKILILAYSPRGIQYTMVGKKERSSLGRHGGWRKPGRHGGGSEANFQEADHELEVGPGN